MTIVDALADRHLFGALSVFRNLATWRAWLVFLRAAYGLPLSDEDRAHFQRHSGRTEYRPPPGGWPEVVCVVGRQSGKTRIAATVAAFEAATAAQESDGAELYGLLIAQDQRAAMRTALRYTRAPFDNVPMLAQVLTNSTADTLTLSNGCTVAAYPARPAAVRGLRARVVVLDELAFYRSSDNLPTDAEMLRAVRPCLATTGGKLFILSSPYAQSGALYDLHRRHFGRNDSAVLVWQASAPEMNPTLSPDYLARMAQDDPEAYRSEVLGGSRRASAHFSIRRSSARASKRACASDHRRRGPRMSPSTIRRRAQAPMRGRRRLPIVKAIASCSMSCAPGCRRSTHPASLRSRRRSRKRTACTRRLGIGTHRGSCWKASARTASRTRRVRRTAAPCTWNYSRC